MAYNIVTFLFVSNVIRMSACGRPFVIVPTYMERAKLVPDIISVAPPQYLFVTYPSDVHVKLGNELKPRQVKDEPIIEWRGYHDGFFTLCMIDADYHAPNPSSRQFQHLLVGNIPGNTHKVDEGDILSQYIGAFPSEETGLHRYVFLVYQQPRKLNFDEPRLNNKSSVGRSEFSITEFVEKYKLGNPIIGNFFKAQWDESATELHESLDR